MARSRKSFLGVAFLLLGAGIVALLALDSKLFSKRDPARNACINNLRQIEGCKEQWAIDHNKPAGTLVTWPDILPYFKSDPRAECDKGGVYTIGVVSNSPSCSVHGDLDNYKSK